MEFLTHSISVVKTEDIPFLCTSKEPSLSTTKNSPMNVTTLQHNIKTLMEFLLNGCASDGTYWLYKEEGDLTVRLMELSSVFGLPESEEMSEEEKKRREITWKWRWWCRVSHRSMMLNLCMHYAGLLKRESWSRSSQSEQYLLVNGIWIVQVVVR